jgi:hypothetical protein
MGHMTDHINEGYDELARNLDGLPKTIFNVIKELEDRIKSEFANDDVRAAYIEAREIIRRHTRL